jgi:tubulin polyglutamylase TTLL6/13
MHRFFEKEYEFFPKTWILPQEQNDFKLQFTKKKAKTFIVKPAASCQGRGIFLTRDFESIDMKSGETYVV